MSRKLTQIQWTDDYSQFKFLEYNRDVDMKRVHILSQRMREHGFLVPILVNQEYYVVDGQHRFHAAKQANISIGYVVFNLTEDNLPIVVADLNSSSKTWNNNDYYNMWSDLGYPEYLWMGDIMKRMSLPFNIFFFLMKQLSFSAEHVKGGKSFVAEYRSGKMQLSDEKKQKIEERCANLRELATKEPKYSEFGDAFLTALAVMVQKGKYDHNVAIKAFDDEPGSLLKAKTKNDYLGMLESMYNRVIGGKNRKGSLKLL